MTSASKIAALPLGLYHHSVYRAVGRIGSAAGNNFTENMTRAEALIAEIAIITK
jgi:hypothetical protein